MFAKRFAPFLALLAAGCTATATGTVTPGASTAPSSGPSVAVSAAPSTAASTSPAAKPSAAASAAPSSAPSAAASGAPAVDADLAEACEHMAEGPAESKQANLLSMSRERAVLKAEHRRWDVQLVESAGKYEGYVLMENDEEGEFHFSLGADAAFVVKQDGKTVAFSETKKTGLGCDALKAHYAAKLAIGQVELHFGPTTEKAVSVVIEHHEHAAGEADHDHAD